MDTDCLYGKLLASIFEQREGNDFPYGSMSRSSLPLSQPQREQHRNLFAISAVIVAIETDQVALFELDRDENVSRGHDREEEVTGGHSRRRPEGDDEPKIKRMSHHLIQCRRFERRRLFVFTDQIIVNLLHPKEAEVIDEIS